MSTNKVIFAGAGPGAPDLMTVRCFNAVKEADVIIYAGSLISDEVVESFKSDCEVFNSAGMTLDEVISVIEEKYNQGKAVLRLHSGDPSMYGTLIEQFNRLDISSIEYEVIPGVSSVFASAASLKTELTLPTVSQTLILTRDSGRTPVPPNETLEKLASHQTSMAIFLSVQKIDDVVRKLLIGGYFEHTPVAIVHRASWPDERIIRGTLSDIAEKIQKEKITNQGMIIVGDVLKKHGELSGLYHAAFTHEFREADKNAALPKYLEKSQREYVQEKDALRSLKCTAIYSLTENGFIIGLKIAKGLGDNCQIYSSIKYQDRDSTINVNFFEPIEFKNIVKENWNEYKNHIFIMATGITVRVIAPLLKSKLTDPAVISCDDIENYAISLVSGHIGGANKLVTEIAKITEYTAVITTASDIRGLNSIDEFAVSNNWRIENPQNIKFINSALIENKHVFLLCNNKSTLAKIRKSFPNLQICDDINTCDANCIIAVDCNKVKTNKNVLWIKTAR